MSGFLDYELLYKLATFLLGAIATWRVVVELIRGRHGSLRDEFKFAKEFLQELKADPDMHPFLKQKGFQAIAGDPRLSPSMSTALIDFAQCLLNSVEI